MTPTNDLRFIKRMSKTTFGMDTVLQQKWADGPEVPTEYAGFEWRDVPICEEQ